MEIRAFSRRGGATQILYPLLLEGPALGPSDGRVFPPAHPGASCRWSLLVVVVDDLSVALRSQENCAVRQQITPAVLQTRPEPTSNWAKVLLCTNMFRLSRRKAKVDV